MITTHTHHVCPNCMKMLRRREKDGKVFLETGMLQIWVCGSCSYELEILIGRESGLPVAMWDNQWEGNDDEIMDEE